MRCLSSRMNIKQDTTLCCSQDALGVWILFSRVNPLIPLKIQQLNAFYINLNKWKHLPKPWSLFRVITIMVRMLQNADGLLLFTDAFVSFVYC